MKLIGLIGWRGMVGSVLLERMEAENDFLHIEPVFFSTSNSGGELPKALKHLAKNEQKLQDAYDLDVLKRCEIIVTAQGGAYTSDIFPRLRRAGWKGHWIDAASTLRMNDDAIIVLDPVNLTAIREALVAGGRNWVGGNCTVSCMLMGLGSLYKAGLVDWMSTMTYQAASGGGAAHMRELLRQFGTLHSEVSHLLDNPEVSILEIDRQLTNKQRTLSASEVANFGVPLGGNVIPWIDSDLGDGVSKEEWKGSAETNKILGFGGDSGKAAVAVDGFCVRVGAMRCHSQALMFKLKKNVPLSDVEQLITQDNQWVSLIPNERESSMRDLTPVAITGSMSIAVGRLRKLAMGPEYLGAFTVGDQLLWGAAEPLRRILRILVEA
jgi:aspartate-semialdehyde dehydrogenase